MNKNYFSQFMPINFDLIKSDKNDDGRIYIKGIISTETIDAQGEILKQDGLDFSYFLKRGYINSEHKQGAENMLGAPTKVSQCMYKGKPAHYMEGYLFSDMPKVQDIISVCNAMKKAKSDRGLGFSVEGKVEERDKKNPTIITKAKILNVSLVAAPANPDSMLELLKSMEAQMEKDMSINSVMQSMYADSYVKEQSMPITAEDVKQIAMEALSKDEADCDGEMTLANLMIIKEYTDTLCMMIEPNSELPEWVQQHIALASDYIHSAAHYLKNQQQMKVVQNMSGQMKELQDKIQMALETMNMKNPMSTSLMDTAQQVEKGYEDIQKPSLDSNISNADFEIQPTMPSSSDSAQDFKFSDEEALKILTTIMRNYPGLSKDEYMKMFYRVVAAVAEKITEGKVLPTEMK